MSKRQQIAREVHSRLIAAEIGIDDALTLAAELGAYLPKARQGALLAAEAGHEAISDIGAAWANLLQARTSMVKAHQGLLKLAEDMKLPPSMFGGAYGKPTARALALVADQKAA